MINKRLLIKNLLAHNDENSFYDKKRKVNIGHKEGKAKLLKHICALSNSNPSNNSYIVIGVQDEDNKITGVDFFDDSKIQNLINAYLSNPPIVQYENIPFPHLPEYKVVGLVTIRPKKDFSITSLRKNIWKYYGGAVFMRKGSMSMPQNFDIEIKNTNSKIVQEIENHAKNNIEYTLSGVLDFMKTKSNFNPQYIVFKEYFVLCWSGEQKIINNETFTTRVDIELINERVRLFYSNLDRVSISHNHDSFTIKEYVKLGLQESFQHYPFEETIIKFSDNANYSISSKLIFSPPQYDKKTLHHIYNSNNSLINKLLKEIPLTGREIYDLINLPATFLICYLNQFDDAIIKLQKAKNLLKKNNIESYINFKEAMRILRKIKYN